MIFEINVALVKLPSDASLTRFVFEKKKERKKKKTNLQLDNIRWLRAREISGGLSVTQFLLRFGK